jgi:hypothetical protein
VIKCSENFQNLGSDFVLVVIEKAQKLSEIGQQFGSC